MKFKIDAYFAIKNMVGYGVCFGKTGWRKEVAPIRTKEMINVMGIPTGMFKEVTKEAAVYDAPSYDRIPFWDAYPHPDETAGLQRRLPFIHRKVVDIEEILEVSEPAYKNLKALKKIPKWNIEQDRVTRPEDEFGFTRPELDTNAHNIEIIEWWGDKGRRVVTVANRELIIRDERNPFYHAQNPILSTPYAADLEGGVYGMSILETVESLIFELIDMRNQTMDNVNMALRAPLAGDINRLEDPENTVFEINNLIGTYGKPNDVIMKFDVPDYTGRAVQLDPILKGEIASDTGITDYAKGVPAEGMSNETATGISLLIEQMNKRLQPIVDMFNETHMKPLATQIKHLNHQFIDQVEFPYDDGFEHTNHAHFKPDFNIKCNGSVAYTSKVLRSRLLRELIGELGGNPHVNILPILHEIFLLNDFNNINEILIPEPPEPKKEDPKVVVTMRSDMSPEQQALLLKDYGYPTSPEDLMAQNLQKGDEIVQQQLKTENEFNRLVDKNNQTEERKSADANVKGDKQNANPSGR